VGIERPKQDIATNELAGELPQCPSGPERNFQTLYRELADLTVRKQPMRWAEITKRLQVLYDRRDSLRDLVREFGLYVRDPELSNLPRSVCKSIHWIQEEVRLSDDDKLSQKPKTGFWHIDSVKELRARMNQEGRELLLVQSGDAVLAYYTQRLILGKDLRKADEKMWKALQAAGLNEMFDDMLISIDHEVVLPQNYENVANMPLKAKRDMALIRASLYATLNVFAMEEDYRNGVALSLARCRYKPKLNPALNSHIKLGWKMLDPEKIFYSEVEPTKKGEPDANMVDAVLWTTPTFRHTKYSDAIKEILPLKIEDRNSSRPYTKDEKSILLAT